MEELHAAPLYGIIASSEAYEEVAFATETESGERTRSAWEAGSKEPNPHRVQVQESEVANVILASFDSTEGAAAFAKNSPNPV